MQNWVSTGRGQRLMCSVDVKAFIEARQLKGPFHKLCPVWKTITWTIKIKCLLFSLNLNRAKSESVFHRVMETFRFSSLKNTKDQIMMTKALCRSCLTFSIFRELCRCCLQWCGLADSLWRATCGIAHILVVWGFPCCFLNNSVRCNPILILEGFLMTRDGHLGLSVFHYLAISFRYPSYMYIF